MLLLAHDGDEVEVEVAPLNFVVVCVNPRAAFDGTWARWCRESERGVWVEDADTDAAAEDTSAEHDRRSSSSVRGLSWVIGRDIGFSPGVASFGENFVF